MRGNTPGSGFNAAGHAALHGSAPLSRMIVQWDMPATVAQRAFEVQGLLAAQASTARPAWPISYSLPLPKL
jgi:hypothetical protein